MSFIWVTSLVASGLIGCFFGYFFSKKNNPYKKLYNELHLKQENIDYQLNELSQSIARKQVTIEFLDKEKNASELYKLNTQETLSELQTKLSHLEAQKDFFTQQRQNDFNEIDHLKNQIAILTQEKENITATKNDIELKLNTIYNQNTHLQQRLDIQNQEFERLQQHSAQKFENLAHKIFNEKSQNSEKALTNILTPVKESLNKFQDLVTEKFNYQDKERGIFKAELEKIIYINEKMTSQTQNLTKALKGDNKIMGNWGEMLLERILEDSGLTKNIDYVLQSSTYDLKDQEGKRQIPDVIIKLPDNKEIIIDAKVSLIQYENIISNPEQKELHEKSLLKSMRQHIDELSAKKYYENEKLLSPDFTLMFMPVEGAYNLAMQLDNQLHHYAWNKRIAIVSNTTLFATLRTVASLWRIDKQNKNADEIAKRAGMLYDKFSGFINDLHVVEKRLDQTQSSFNDALSKLYKGQGCLISRVESLKKLGAKTSKKIEIDKQKEYLMEVSPELLEMATD